MDQLPFLCSGTMSWLCQSSGTDSHPDDVKDSLQPTTGLIPTQHFQGDSIQTRSPSRPQHWDSCMDFLFWEWGRQVFIRQKSVWWSRRKGDNWESLRETTSTSSLVVHHFLKMHGSMIQYVSISLQCGTILSNQDWWGRLGELHVQKAQVLYQKPPSALLLYNESLAISFCCMFTPPKIASFLNCNFGKLLRWLYSVLWW